MAAPPTETNTISAVPARLGARVQTPQTTVAALAESDDVVNDEVMAWDYRFSYQVAGSGACYQHASGPPS